MKTTFFFLLIVSLLIITNGRSSSRNQKNDLKRYEFTYTKMGTLFRIITYSPDEKTAQDAALAAYQRIDELNQVFSDYIPDSECMQLSGKSGSGEWMPVSNDMYSILQLSLDWSEKTQGTFDVSIGSLSQMWRRAVRKERLPNPGEIEEAMKAVGYKNILLSDELKLVSLRKPGTFLDFGGIVKGFAVDEAYKIFFNYGLERTLVDGGGDIYVGVAPPDREGWKIMIRNQDNKNQFVMIENMAIATSGDLYRFIELGGKKYSHIIDPRKGYGINLPRTVTVMASDATSADVMASALSILGPEGFIMLERSNMKAMIIQEVDGKLEKWECGQFELME